MSLAKSRMVSLKYGEKGCFSCEMEADRISAVHAGPEPSSRFAEELEEALSTPLEFPPLEQAVIPDDQITLALDLGTPEAASLMAAVWNMFAKRNVQPENVMIVQPPNETGGDYADPRSQLPKSVREQIGWKIHDPTQKNSCTYLATSSGGERIYLSREVAEADVVISIGQISFDPVLGYRGTNSVMFPGLSDEEASHRARGQGHRELSPDDERPLRQMIDEIGYLLGTQFSIQVTPSAGGGVSRIIAGAMEAVLREGKQQLTNDWLVELEERADLVVAAVDADAGGHGWQQIGSALAAARNLVARDGKIVILSELAEEPGEGLNLLSQCESPGDAIGPLRKMSPADLLPATQLAAAADWAQVYLLSQLPSDQVEDLFMVPLENEKEVQRVLDNAGDCVFLSSAQHCYGRISE